MAGIKTFQLDIDEELPLNGGDPINPLGAATKQYVDSRALQNNTIINGNFDIWQRGSSLSAGTGERYLADRWVSESIGTTHAITREAFALGQIDVPNHPRYYHRSVIASVAATGNRATFRQRIENVESFSGETITISFWAKADVAKNIALEITQNFGTGGSPSATVTAIDVSTHALTTSWQQFVVTASMPSVTAKTLGTDNNDYLELIWWFEGGSDWDARTNTLGQQSGTFDIAQIQVTKSSTLSDFIIEDITNILTKCQRYYEKTYELETAPASLTGLGMRTSFDASVQTPVGTINLTHEFFTIKRSRPTIVLYSPSSGAPSRISMSQGVGAVINLVVNSVTSTENGIVNVSVNNGLAVTDAARVWNLHFTADAEL